MLIWDLRTIYTVILCIPLFDSRFLLAYSVYSDQTGFTPRLFLFFAGRIVKLFVMHMLILKSGGRKVHQHSRHTTLTQRCINVNATSDVDTTLFGRHAPAGKFFHRDFTLFQLG